MGAAEVVAFVIVFLVLAAGFTLFVLCIQFGFRLFFGPHRPAPPRPIRPPSPPDDWDDEEYISRHHH